MRTLIMMVFVIGAFGFIAFQIYQFLFSVGGSRSRIEKDKNELKQLVHKITDDLVPITTEELSLLSSKLESQRVTKGMYYTELGMLSSIYNEPMVSYGYRNYGRGKSVLVANTQNGVYEFVERDEIVELKINGYVQGVIGHDGLLKDVQGEPIAEIKDDPRSDYQQISIRERKVAELLNPEAQDITQNTRAYLDLKPIDVAEQNILLGLTIFNTLIKT